MSTTQAVSSPQAGSPMPFKLLGPGAIVLVVIYASLFWEFLWRQARWAIEHQADWGHTLVIPCICAYFVYLNRQRLLSQPFRPAWLGLLPMLLGVAWYVAGSLGPRVLQHHNVQAIGVWLTLVGIILLMTGWRATLIMAFPLLYLFVFGQTISDRFLQIITFKMQDITARGAHVMLVISGLSADRSGNTLSIFYNGELHPLNVAEACSGMRMLMAFLALGVFMAYTGLRRFWQRTLLVVLAVPTAIFVNMLRVYTLGLLSLVDVDFAAGDFHSFIGLVWLVPALFIYLGLMWIIRHLVVESPGAAPDSAAA